MTDAPTPAGETPAPKTFKIGPTDEQAQVIVWNIHDTTKTIAFLAAFWIGLVFLLRYAVPWTLEHYGPLADVAVFAVGVIVLGYFATGLFGLWRKFRSTRTH